MGIFVSARLAADGIVFFGVWFQAGVNFVGESYGHNAKPVCVGFFGEVNGDFSGSGNKADALSSQGVHKMKLPGKIFLSESTRSTLVLASQVRISGTGRLRL